MISSSWENFWLLVSSSQAAVTDTTSGLMLFSCSSNWSLNKMASSLTFSCFTVDIWQERKGRDAGMRRFLTIDTSVLWEYWRGWFYLLRILRSWTKLLVFCSVAQGFSVSNKYLLRPRPLQFRCVLFLFFFYHIDSLCCVCGWLHSSQLTAEDCTLLTTTPNCSDSAMSSYSFFISPSASSWLFSGSCFNRF